MSKDWTNKLPELLEGYTEAEPEGLWDAVQAGLAPKPRRHVIAAWWYAGGALLAAAAVSAVFFLWPSRPVHPSVTPIAEVASSSEETIVPEVTVVPGELIAHVPSAAAPDPVIAVPDPVIAVPERQSPAESTAPVAESSQIAPEEPPMAPLESQYPPETLPQDAPVTHDEPSSAAPSTVIPSAPPTIPAAPPQKRVQPLKVQIGLSGTGYLSQIATSTTTGVGIPVNLGIRPNSMPLTKASSSGSTNESVMTRMLSRNKASTTNAVHGQTARLALGVTIGITEHWAVETGAVFSTLFSSYTTEAGGSNETLSRTMKYCGIPLYARYNALEWKRLSLFLNAGPMYEFTTKTSVNKTTFAGRAQTGYTSDNTLVKDVKWSLNAGGGVQLRVLEHGALYVLPGVSYHIAGNSTLENYYTEHPLSASLTFGYNFIF